MKYDVVVNGKKYEVIVEEADRHIKQEHRTVEAAKAPAKTREASASEAAGEEDSVKSPMPGTIISVHVKEGQAVKKGTVLFILEAMKMENEIMAGRDAVISKVHVSKGSSVQTGDFLALLA